MVMRARMRAFRPLVEIKRRRFGVNWIQDSRLSDRWKSLFRLSESEFNFTVSLRFLPLLFDRLTDGDNFNHSIRLKC